MTRVERVHEAISSPPSREYFERKSSEGWRLAAVVWERDAPAAEPRESLEEVPFGLKVAGDCQHLEENPDERQVLLTMLELLVQDRSLPAVAEELNRRGLPTRTGSPWNPATVFHLLPQLIETGPKVLRSEEWVSRRQRILQAL